MTHFRTHPDGRFTGIVVVAAVLLAACSASTAPARVLARAAHGGTVTFAEQPSAPPNYIFPLESGAYSNNNNQGQFSYIMYPPLYRFGENGEPLLNKKLSMAFPPVFSDHDSVATVTMKHWMWSNGTPITARDVIFWMNILSAASDPNGPPVSSDSGPGPSYGKADLPAFPYNLVSYIQTGTYTVVFHLNASYSPTWYLDNELSQIYPMPQQSWDKLSLSGPIGDYDTSSEARTLLPVTSTQTCSDCYVPAKPGTATTGALGVAQFLNVQSQDLSTYATNPLWQVVDGPFRLTQFTTEGYVKMVPNTNYSGPSRPKISALEEIPFTTDAAEFLALRSGSLTIGYIPAVDLPQRAEIEKQGGYKEAVWYVYGMTYLPLNFTNPTVGPIFSQLYFRQALQSLINQPEYIKDFSDGVGSIGNGLVPTYPPHDPFVSPLEAKGPVYPYDPAKAVKLLQEHGWDVQPKGNSVCTHPGAAAGDCGAGIKAGQAATFSFLYASGSVQLTDEVAAMQSEMKEAAGITLSPSEMPADTLTGITFNNCSPATPCSNWEIADWGVLSYSYCCALATGDKIFSNENGNPGDYVSADNTANKLATETAPTQAAEIKAMFKYGDYVARQLPMLWMPNAPLQVTMYKNKLKGLLPQGIFTEIWPQYYSFTT
jgi:peptide/nickel transport system substrate-binding protein